MKKLLFMLSLAMLVVGGCCNKCAAEELIKYVPANADGIVAVDVARLVKLPHFSELRKENKDFDDNWSGFESELQKYGLKKDDLPSNIMVFFKADAGDQKEAGILALTKITEAKLQELLKANEQKLAYTTETIAGRKAYIVNQKEEQNEYVALTYLAPDTVMICDKEKAKDFFANAGKVENEKIIKLDAKVDKKSLAYVLFSHQPPAPSKEEAANPMMGGNPLEKMTSAIVALDVTGKNNKDVNLKADLNCVDVASASQMANQLKTLLMIMTMQLGANPELNKMVTEAVAIDQKDKNVTLAVSITETLIAKLKDFAKERAKQTAAAMPVADVSVEKAPAEKVPAEKTK